MKNWIKNIFGIRFFNIFKNIKNYKYNFNIKKFFVYILYKINLLIIFNFKIKTNHSFINKKNFLKTNVKLDEFFLSRVNEDLKIKEYNLFNNNFSKYLLWHYPLKYLNEVQMSWGFDRNYYIEFLKKNFDDDLKRFYSGKNYRVEHVWLYKNLPFSKNVNNNYHTDGDLPGALKIIIYLSNVDMSSGPFSLVDNTDNKICNITGDAGTTIIFDQTKLLHSGLPNKEKERIVLSFLIYPTLRKKISVDRLKPLNALCTVNPFTNFS